MSEQSTDSTRPIKFDKAIAMPLFKTLLIALFAQHMGHFNRDYRIRGFSPQAKDAPYLQFFNKRRVMTDHQKSSAEVSQSGF